MSSTLTLFLDRFSSIHLFPNLTVSLVPPLVAFVSWFSSYISDHSWVSTSFHCSLGTAVHSLYLSFLPLQIPGIYSFGFICHPQANSSQVYTFQCLPARLLHSHAPVGNVPQTQLVQKWNYSTQFKLWAILGNLSFSPLYPQIQLVTVSYQYHPMIPL